MDIAKLLWLGSLPGKLRNKLFNKAASLLVGGRVGVEWQGLKIRQPRNIRIGRNFCSGRSLWLESVGEGRLVIGDDVNFSDSVHIGAAHRVEIQSGVLIGSRVLVIDHSHGRTEALAQETIPPVVREIVSAGPILIERNVWIGDGVTILANVTIGEGAIVGANSVVTRDVPPFQRCAGVPARVLG